MTNSARDIPNKIVECVKQINKEQPIGLEVVYFIILGALSYCVYKKLEFHRMINFFKEFYSNLASKSEPTKTEEFVKVEKSDGGFKHPLLLVSSETLQDVSLLILAMVLIVASLALKNHLINWVNVAISKTFGLQTVSNEEYEKQKEEHTN